ncbi:MAG: MFS transporter [Verrucomicrobiae bacterium]|nr:MFS transporter [Verrucomicrobiae bacterium]
MKRNESDALSHPAAPRYSVGSLRYTKAGLAALFAWMLWGDFCFTLMETVVPSIIPLSLKSLNASNVAISLIVVVLPGILYSTVGVWVSFWSDRYRSRLGRRIPFILFTAPMLVVFLCGFGFHDRIAKGLYAMLPCHGHVTEASVGIVTIGVLMVGFAFFNNFVGAVYWYLFNDVVPECFLARFMSLFRVVGTGTGAFYSFFVFRYAETHFREIFVAAALLYLFGFGLMCFKVREGEYPPPPENIGNRKDVWGGLVTFVRECYCLPHYWYLFLMNTCVACSGTILMFTVFWHQSLGLGLKEIGIVSGAASIAGGVMILLSGWLADRYHPIRVVVIGLFAAVLMVTPLNAIWLFHSPAPNTAFLILLGITIIASPVLAFIGIGDPPLLMRIFPRERYGQFCGANALFRNSTTTLGGIVAGVFLDFVKARCVDGDFAYRFIPIWMWFFQLGALICAILLYRSWKKYGGDELYHPPLPGLPAQAPAYQ